MTIQKIKGLTLVETLVGITLLAVSLGGIYIVYASILDSLTNSQLRALASTALNRQIEIVRNLPYQDVGIVGGSPAGKIPETQTTTVSGVEFQIDAAVRNIDDPFDGTVTSTPADTAPADYKLVELVISCPPCRSFIPLRLTARSAPKNLESATNNGSLFINVFDASGVAVEDATVRVVNSQVSPPIDLTDTTNSDGQLQLIDIPTSTESYEISVSKNGYSSDQTYPPGAPGNPNPVKPHATVAQQQLTQLSFAIDKTSQITVKSRNATCTPLAAANFSISGEKLIGTDPNILKFSTTTATDSGGLKSFNALEWDTYSLQFSDNDYDLTGTSPFSPVVLNPDSAAEFVFTATAETSTSLLVIVTGQTGGLPVNNASVTLDKVGFNKTLLTGRHSLEHTSWESYTSQSGGIDTGSPAGTIKLAVSGPGYPTSTVEWLIGHTLDLGTSSVNFFNLSWQPVSQPPETGSESVKFQLASNNDNATWNFIGPDGTSGAYYTAPSQIYSGHNGDRYLRYKAFLSTQDENFTPQIDDIGAEFGSGCVPDGQILFSNLETGDYDVNVDASGYQTATSSAAVLSGWQKLNVSLLPL